MDNPDFPIDDTQTFLDHIDGNTLNDRIDNLRIATRAQTLHTQKLRKKNKSGVKGVWYVQTNKFNVWGAQIGVNSKLINLGFFQTKEAATAARRAAEIKYYGEFRCTGDEIGL
jgi:HNH endonuclease